MIEIDFDKIRDMLKKEELALDISQTKQAKDLIGRSQSHINRFVSGKRGVGAEVFLDICAHLNKCPLVLLKDGQLNQFTKTSLQRRLINLCQIMFDDDFPFDEPDAFELLAVQIDSLYKKHIEKKRKDN